MKTMKITDLFTGPKERVSVVAELLGVSPTTVYRYRYEPHKHVVVKDGEVYSLFVRVGG